MEWLKTIRGVVLVVAPIGFFFQRDLLCDGFYCHTKSINNINNLLSVDNTTWFIAYWLFVPMAIWFVVEKIVKDQKRILEESSSESKEREFIKKSIEEIKAENKAKKSVIKEEKLKKENPKQFKESKEYKLKNLKDFYEKELISKEVYEKRQLEILSE